MLDCPLCGHARRLVRPVAAWRCPPRSGPGARSAKRAALLPPYTTGSVRIPSNLDIKLGRVIGGWQWRAADRRCASRCGHSLRRASGLGVAFVGALCRRIDSQGVDPRSLNWKISSPGKARDRSPAPRPSTTPGRPANSSGQRPTRLLALNSEWVRRRPGLRVLPRLNHAGAPSPHDDSRR